jgi:uncharacterized protein YidB (DUF937 family)
MGFLDELVGQVLRPGQERGRTSGMAGVLSQLLGGQGSNEGGGLARLLEQFRGAGLGHIAESWVGNGPNHPVTPGQLRDALGEDQTQQMARQSGLSVEDLLGQLAQHLPGLVDRMTPSGRVPRGEAGGTIET